MPIRFCTPRRCLSFATLIFLLAQSTKQANNVVPWVIALVIAVLVLFGGALLVRKWMLRGDISPGDEGLLESMRRMRDEGKLSDEEYQQARKQMIGKAAERMKTSDKSAATLDAAKTRSHNRKPNAPGGKA